MNTELLPLLISVLTLISVWAVFFFSIMYLIKVVFEKLEEHRNQNKER